MIIVSLYFLCYLSQVADFWIRRSESMFLVIMHNFSGIRLV